MRHYKLDLSNVPNYDNNKEFKNFDFFKYLLPDLHKDKEDNVIEEIIEHVEKLDLNTLKVSQLKRMCKGNGIKGYSKKKKSELIDLLKELKL